MKKGLEKFNELVDAFARLPGVGKKSAQRYAYFVSLQDSFGGLKLAQSIEDAVRFIRRCECCGGLSEDEICDICSDENRDKSKLVIVESPRDILVFEQNAIYDGLYFVLDDLSEQALQKLRSMISKNGINEVIFAFTPGLNSDAIMLFTQEKLGFSELNFSKIAQGVPTGVSLENIDMLSLIKAFESRVKT
ncbi:recombination mediator RecR [Campylobacter suis]|uniref:Recombination protein RecR n=1 Tax=Campylobacter suis TaxID=2790657 RepID=A0ABM8Q861_9BACT|nr:recombination mediator RecR [Campylobacter suis]CAD7289139.1 Recombination protein RecR [Campylobacter suis]